MACCLQANLGLARLLLLLLVALLLLRRYACAQHLLLLLGLWPLSWLWCKAAKRSSLLLLCLLVVLLSRMVAARHPAVLPLRLARRLQGRLQHCPIELHRLTEPVTIVRVEGRSMHASWWC